MDSAAIIRKNIVGLRERPNFVDYEGERRAFDWNALGRSLTQGARTATNLAELAVDRHAVGPLAQASAYRFLARGAAARDISYAELSRLSNRFCNVLRGARRRQGRAGLRAGGTDTRALPRGARQPEEWQRGFAAVLGLRPRADRDAREPRRGQGAGHHRHALPAQGREVAREDAHARTCAAGRRGRRHDERRRHPRPGDADGGGRRCLCGHADRRRGYVAAALHQRHDGDAEGRGACAWRRGDALGHRPLRTRSACRRHLLVHRRSGLGDRHLLRHHRAAAAWRNVDRGPRGVRCRTLVRHPAG